ncbi:MAG: hypothetical protein RIC24_10890 [Hyphomicrobiales bacterium]
MRPSVHESGAVDQRAQGAANFTVGLRDHDGRASRPAKRALRPVDIEAIAR